MSKITIWHNPRCSKSREALRLLRENGVEPEIRDYIQDPPSAEEITWVLGMLGMRASQILRRKDARELGIQVVEDNDAAIIAAMVENPRLIERPIVISGKHAVVGRPPENVLDLLRS